MEKQFMAGFAREDITPEEYMTLAGFGNDAYRMCNNVLDHVFGTVVVLQDKQENRVALCTVDLLNAKEDTVVKMARDAIFEATGIPTDHIMVSVTHTHAGPSFYSPGEPLTGKFLQLYSKRMAKAAQLAIEDLKPATAQIGSTIAEKLCFKRHYVLEDGTVATHGSNQKKLQRVAHAAPADEQLQVIRFVREGGRDIVLVNFQCHATTTSGFTRYDLSADFPGTMRDHLEGLSGCYCAYYQGACGDLVPRSLFDELNIIEKGDYVTHGRKIAEYAFDCLQNNMQPAELGTIKTVQFTYSGPVDHSEDDRVEEAKKVREGFYDLPTDADRQARLKQYGFNSYLQAGHIIRRANSGDTHSFELDAVRMGDISFATAPFEMFSSNGKFVKDNSPYKMTFMCAYCNGANAYIADDAAYDYTTYCYEVDSRTFPRGGGEDIASNLVRLLEGLQD